MGFYYLIQIKIGLDWIGLIATAWYLSLNVQTFHYIYLFREMNNEQFLLIICSFLAFMSLNKFVDWLNGIIDNIIQLTARIECTRLDIMIKQQ